MANRRRVLAIDLDETIGFWILFGVFWDALTHLNGAELGFQHFEFALDQFPEFIRPGIISTLKMVQKRKQSGACSLVVLYTNNNADRSWAESLVKYINLKVGSSVIDKIVAGYHCEACRTSRRKSYQELLKCCRLPRNTRVMFIDDQVHQGMDHPNVSYIRLTPHVALTTYEDMAERYISRLVPGKKAEAPKLVLVDFCSQFREVQSPDTSALTKDESTALHKQVERFFKTGKKTRRK